MEKWVDTLNLDSHRLIGVDRHLAAQVQVLWAIIDQNQILRAVLEAAAGLMPPDWYLGAGCIAQTVWNYMSERDLMVGVKDLDLVYYDAADLSEETESAYLQRVREQFGGVSIHIDVKNEARVHLWYEKRFGYPIKPYSSLEDAINTWPTTATSIGVRRSRDESVVYAPYGLNDLFAMVVRPNKKQITREVYEAKARRWLESWPSLQIIPW
ncbi:MAG TPA: nucleotidyltransferase family protein [Symbiobacteriaceae bacterium]|nr:nucleotidyltransferase family protein [Symbiobacteriaceae bacterium]